MDDFAQLGAKEKAPFFEAAAAEVGTISAYIIEKDFWVCWTLKRLFEIPSLNEHMIFKGGTSLSKVFGVIERFSEDIDISISKEFLGFGGENDPEKAGGSNKTKDKIEALAAKCSEYVNGPLLTELSKAIETKLGKGQTWKLELDPEDKDKQTLLFTYPGSQSQANKYINPWVKIEVGARSDQWPARTYSIQPYLSQFVKDSLKDPDVKLKAMDAKRTFWEKATILHAYANLPDDKKVGERQSRHYYDLYRLLKTSHLKEAIDDLALLERVAKHKSIYFRAGWAKYETAKKGSLKLIPGDLVKNHMRQDYERMREMIYGEAPPWTDILTAISKFEAEFNN